MIINSTRLRSDYNHISDMCRENGEPVFITKNGDGDTVLMSMQVYEQFVYRVKLAADILESERARLAGGKTYSIEEVSEEMRKIIDAECIER